MKKYIPLSIDEATLLDEKDREAGAAHHQRGMPTYQRGQTWRPSWDSELTEVLQVQSHDIDGSVTAEEIAQWEQYGMLPVGQGGRERSVRKQKGYSEVDILHACSLLEQSLVDEAPQWSGQRLVPRPIVRQERFVLLLFSGHRRYGDIASWLQWDGAVTPLCIDVAVHPHFGDVHRDDLWIRLIKSGCVIGAHAGPPCETYTAARWLEELGRLFPRPLRDSSFPWGLPNLSLKEVRQVSIGTLLMLKTLQLLMLVYAYGGAFTLEHPTGDDLDARKWSIWKSGMVQRLLQSGDFRKTRFIQGPLGQPFAKPTTFLSARLPLLDQHLYASYQPGLRPTKVLGGVENGEWRTAESKVYPVKLCCIIAQQLLWHNSQVAGCDDVVDLAFLQDAREALASTWDAYGGENAVMCKDYFASTEVFT